MSKSKFQLFGIGDFSASATIVFDNLTNMAVIAFLLMNIFGMPADIVLGRIIPGLSVGIVFVNAVFIYMAYKLSKKTGRNDICAFPAGLDVPTSIGISLSVIGPVFLMSKSNGLDPSTAALHAWYIGSACSFFIGAVKFLASFFIEKIKHLIPTVALLGGLAGVAIGLIIFMPLISMLEMPIISFAVLTVIIMVFFAGYRLPGNFPSVLFAIILGLICYYIVQIVSTGHVALPSAEHLKLSLPVFDSKILTYIKTAFPFYTIAFPFAMIVIFGTVSVSESARVIGSNYSTKSLLMYDGIATMLMGVFGGIAQTTAYAGFPAYHKMNARSGYMIANIIFVGIGAWLGLVGYIIQLIPEAVLAPVLLYIGLEIAIQVFMVCDKKYYPAAILGLLPSIARLLEIKFSSNPDLVSMDKLNNMLITVANGKINDISAIVTFGNGFIITGTLWATLVYYMIERKIFAVVSVSVILAIMSFFGVIHSVFLDGSSYWYPNLIPAQQFITMNYVIGYLMIALVSFIVHMISTKEDIAH
ncbi:MAG: hypothetical protein PHC75_03170 [Burkholderiales bacterium]|nr:hypothetical protein [Burkholderiales bacterium]